MTITNLKLKSSVNTLSSSEYYKFFPVGFYLILHKLAAWDSSPENLTYMYVLLIYIKT